MKNKIKSLLNKPVVLLAAAAVLLLAGTVGSTQAALTHYSEDYVAQVDVPNIGVGIIENDVLIADGNAKTTAASTMVKLLHDIDEEIILGKSYAEELEVKNTGSVDSYVRVIVNKSWSDAKGVEDRTLSPEYIELGILDSGDWVVDPVATDYEAGHIVLYYTKVLAPGAVTDAFTDTLRIDNAFETTVEVDTKTDAETGYTIITYTHPFDNYKFDVEVEADAVQIYDAEAAIKSAWGIDVTINEDGTLEIFMPQE